MKITKWNVGDKYYRLTIINKELRKLKNGCMLTYFTCKCDCGNIVELSSRQFGRRAKSCGCMRRERIINMHKTHGGHNTRLYNIWSGMIQRCENKNQKFYMRYGGRGISVCKEWRIDFATFREWANTHGYNENLTIDRIDNDGNYDPSNCRWVGFDIQTNNTSANVLITFNGETKTEAQWAKRYGLQKSTLCVRLKRGWSIERALTTPVYYRGQN